MADRLINILVTITLIEMMVSIGLGVTFADLVKVARDWWLIGRAVAANYLCVPAATVLLLVLFDAHPMIAAGFLILAVCPGAPFAPACAKIARGDVAAAVGWMAILAGSSAIVAPLLLYFLLPLISANETLQVDPVRIVISLLIVQLLPLLVGLGLRHWRRAWAETIQRPANRVSAVLSLLTVGVILFVHYPLLLEIRPRGYVGMTILLIVSWAAGWLLAGRSAELRKSLALTTSLRNVGVGLVIASASFPGTAAVTSVLAYGIFEIFGSILLALWWARRGNATSC
jgi:BASS family bile acid:Na+ symporter